MSAAAHPAPLPGRIPVPGPPPGRTPAADSGSLSGHPAVDAVIQALANVARLAPADQIAQYEAAHRTLQETLASIDHA